MIGETKLIFVESTKGVYSEGSSNTEENAWAREQRLQSSSPCSTITCSSADQLSITSQWQDKNRNASVSI